MARAATAGSPAPWLALGSLPPERYAELFTSGRGLGECRMRQETEAVRVALATLQFLVSVSLPGPV